MIWGDCTGEYFDGNLVVRTWRDHSMTCGPLHVQTADGRVWVESPYTSKESLGTGESLGYLVGNRIEE